MIKKISAIVLALVLCLSVVVMPASAADLASGKKVAFELVLDKEYYSAGDTVTVSVFMFGEPDLELTTGFFAFGCHSDLFDQSVNTNAFVQSGVTMSDRFASYYKDLSGMTWGWQTNATIYNKIVDGNTEEENTLYDQYLKVSLNKLGSNGSHENATAKMNGYLVNDLNEAYANGEATFTFKLKLRDDIPNDTKVNLGITTGLVSNGYSTMTYLTAPGTATSTAKANVETMQCINATATIGEATVPSILKALKGQMRYANTEKTAFDVRALAYISGEDFTATFGDIPTAKSMITEAGFVFAAGSNVGTTIDQTIVEDIVKNYTTGNGRDGFLKKEVKNISTSISDGNYVLSCMVPGVTEAADYNNSLIAVAYIVYEDANGESQYIYYDAAQVIEFAPLFDAKV